MDYLRGQFRKTENRIVRDNNISGMQTMKNNSFEITDEINLNSGYLLSLLKNIENIETIKLSAISGSKNKEYYQSIFEILEMMYDKLECKMMHANKIEYATEIKELLEQTEQIIESANLFNVVEENVYVDGKKARIIKSNLRDIERRLLLFMQASGMLTKVKAVASEALENY